jgi:Cu(I)/Ag(I) efflux system membrane fusion protein
VGQQFDRTLDLFVIADLSKLWVLADAFEGDAQHLAAGSAATVVHPVFRKSFPARLSDVPPVFDPASRTLKVRLAVDNPGSVLRPDMFVDVELSVKAPDALVIPVDAIQDSGSKKTVFVDRGEGFFEPRTVETGSRVGDEVQIVAGLMPGERIVVSGNCLIDSESRMKAAMGGMARPTSKDPICGMDVDEAKARAEGLTSEYRGRAYFFCNPGCKKSFEKDPASFVRESPGKDGPPAGGRPASHGPAHD